MSNSSTFKDFYQVPDVKLDITKLRIDLEKILKNQNTKLGITNFHNTNEQVPGDKVQLRDILEVCVLKQMKLTRSNER